MTGIGSHRRCLVSLVVGVLAVSSSARAQTTVFRYSFSESTVLPTVADVSPAGNDAAAGPLAAISTDIPSADIPPDAGSRSLDSSDAIANRANQSGIVTTNTLLLSNALIAEAGGFTMEAWIKWQGGGAVNSIIDYAGTEKIVLDQRGGPTDQVAFRISPFGDIPIGNAVIDQWHYVAVVFDTEGLPQNGDGTLSGATVTVYFDSNEPVASTENVPKDNFGDSLVRGIGVGMHPLGFDLDFFDGLTFEPRVTLGALKADELLFGADPACPGAARAEVDGTDTILTWTNGEEQAAGTVDVFRGDELVGDDVSADTEMFTDTDVPLGPHEYRLVFSVGKAECRELRVSIDTTPPCDSHCVLIETQFINEGGNNLRVTATATDDTDDPLIYTFRVSRGFLFTETVGPQPEATADFSIRAGNYVITVTVEDDSLCDPPAADQQCEVTNFTVPDLPACTLACSGLTLRQVAAGIEASAAAEDGGGAGNGITYVFEADDGMGNAVTIGPQPESVAVFDVGPGDYTVSATVSDGSACTPVAAGTCEETITVLEGGSQRPGDCNGDGRFDLSDLICITTTLFVNAAALYPCGDGSPGDAANIILLDLNGDERIDLSDAVWGAGHQFGSCSSPPCPPPTQGTGCINIPGCTESPCTED